VIAPELDGYFRGLEGSRLKDAADFCPFCPGEESSCPSDLLRYPEEKEHTANHEWLVRCFPARSPNLRTEASDAVQGEGMYDFMDSVGAHEVLVHSPDHEKTFAAMNEKEILMVLQAYRSRITDLFEDKRFHCVMISCDHGESTGSTLPHPHSQIMATARTPELLKKELEAAKDYYSMKERCVYCDLVRQETLSQKRIVSENENHIAVCPFGSRYPYEVWILPKTHQLNFAEQNDKQMENLAQTVKAVTSAARSALADPDYSLVLHNGPNLVKRTGYWETIEQDYHWHFEFIPSVLQSAGFESGSDLFLNPVSPERAAQEFRDLLKADN